jgi:hypothetical protein
MSVRQQAKKTAGRTGPTLLAATGVGAMLASALQDRIWWILLWFLLGMICLSLLLLGIGDAIERRLRTQQPSWVPMVAGAATVGGLAGVVVVVLRQLWPLAVIVAMFVMTLGLIGLYQWFDRRPIGLVDARLVGPDGEQPVEEPGRIGIGSTTWYGFEAMAVAIGLYLISDGTTTLIGSVVWLAGLVTVKIGSIRFLETRGDQIGRTVRILIDVSLFGLFILFAGAFGSNSVLVLLGLSVVTAALSMVGVGALHLDCPDSRKWWAMGGALAVMGGVWLWMAMVTQNPGLAAVLGLMIALVGGFFVLRGEGIVLLMLAGYILAWGLVDRSVSLADAPVVEGKPVQIVAVGDSFISGEGALKFFEGTNEAGGNQCRRAPTSHPYLMAAALNTNVLSLACSGAKIADLTSCGQMWPKGRRCRATPTTAELEGDAPADPDAPDPLVAVWADAMALYEDEPAGPLPQLVTALGRDAPAEADVVLVSIGGNDVGFSSIVKACLLPKGCEERRGIWLNTIDLLGPQLDEAYAEIRRVFPDAEVLVMPYPMLVNAEQRTSCDLGLSQNEREFVVDFIEKLDSTISQAADRAGFVFVEAGVTAFDGAQLCDAEAGANHLKLVPPEGDKLGRYSPATWIPGSMHPNQLGHELTAVAAVCDVAQALEIAPVSGSITKDRPFSCPAASAVDDGGGDAGGEGDAVGGATGDVGADASAACEAALATDGAASPEEVEACAAVEDAVTGAVDQKIEELAAEVSVVTEGIVSDDEWIQVELFRTVRALALPLVLLLAAGVVFAWGFVQVDRFWLSRFLHQEQDAPDGPTG